MRMILDIDDQILKEVKAVQKREGRLIGAVVSELLSEALDHRRAFDARQPFHWTARPMKPLVDLKDKEAICGVLDTRST
jgi:hypothetical protein